MTPHAPAVTAIVNDASQAKEAANPFSGSSLVPMLIGGLALCLVLGPRLGFKKDAMRPHNLPMVMLGAATGLIRPVTLPRIYAAKLPLAVTRRTLSQMERGFGLVNALVVIIGPVLLETFELRWIALALAVALLVTVALVLARMPVLLVPVMLPKLVTSAEWKVKIP